MQCDLGKGPFSNTFYKVSVNPISKQDKIIEEWKCRNIINTSRLLVP